ncbi:MAG: radical SAM protein [Candidatus Latescibacterota bacterium]
MPRKKGLLVAPEFPADSFWSYKHVLRYVRCRAAFPPLGLLTFAAQLPPDEWDLELVDLNVTRPPAGRLRRRVQEADAVFVGAMNIQRESLVRLLRQVGDTGTPWVLGGPMASTYRDTILHPTTDSDRVLHRGLDYLVWGESQPWIGPLLAALEEHPAHRQTAPHLFIPERVASEPEGSRKYLLDEAIFRPLHGLPVPRWDLLSVRNYRAMMIQTTAGCRFRCSFCDIVQFNGGFARAKEKAAVKRELQAIYDTGFRGGVFTVDDNFVSEPDAMEAILEGMTEFQREHGYPFMFFTQASVDLGKESLAHLVPQMRQAGFTAVFLGIENPDPAALKAMNKVQNIKTAPQVTIQRLQSHGIEVFGGFIYGSDGDTRQTASAIVDFVTENGIFSSMTGKLTPMPHTPLYAELKEQGRLLAGSDPTNNIDESLQFVPDMGPQQFQDGFRDILSRLFNRRAIYQRARSVLERVDLHIFQSRPVGRTEKWCVVRSLLAQGLHAEKGLLDRDYFAVLRLGMGLDRRVKRLVHQEREELAELWQRLSASARSHVELDEETAARFSRMVDYAHEALVRFGTDRGLAEVRQFVQTARESLARGQIAVEHAREVHDRALRYLETRRRMIRFPGIHLVRAFELCIIGYHYHIVARNVLAREAAAEGLVSPRLL